MGRPNNAKSLVIQQRVQELNERITRQHYDYEKDRDYLLRLRERAQGIDDPLLEAETVKVLGTLHGMTREYESAIDYYNQSARLAYDAGDMHGFITAYSNTGGMYERLSRYEEAICAYQQTLDQINLDDLEADSLSGTLLLLRNLSTALYQADRIDEAETCYTKLAGLLTHSHLQEHKRDEFTAILHNGLAQIYRKRGQFDIAWKRLNMAFKAAHAAQIPLQIFYVHNTRLHLALDDTTTTHQPEIYWLQLTAYLEDLEQRETLIFLAQIMLEEAKSYQRQGHMEWARQYAEHALEIYTRFDDTGGMARTEGLLASMADV